MKFRSPASAPPLRLTASMASRSSPLSDHDIAMTPATMAGSDDSFPSSKPSRSTLASNKRWSSRIIRRPNSSGIWVGSSPVCNKKMIVTKRISSSFLLFSSARPQKQQQPPVRDAMVVVDAKKRKAKRRNLLRSAMHKLRKRRNRRLAAGADAAAGETAKKAQQAPPKVRTTARFWYSTFTMSREWVDGCLKPLSSGWRGGLYCLPRSDLLTSSVSWATDLVLLFVFLAMEIWLVVPVLVCSNFLFMVFRSHPSRAHGPGAPCSPSIIQYVRSAFCSDSPLSTHDVLFTYS